MPFNRCIAPRFHPDLSRPGLKWTPNGETIKQSVRQRKPMRLRQLRFANSRAPLSSPFYPSAGRAFPPRRRRRHRRRSPVKVFRIPKSASARTRYSAEPSALKRETFTTLPARRYFPSLPVAPPLFPSLRSCRERRDKAAFRFTR